jgi:UDP-N-acetylglucosamine 2-epimerase (non-hydrolysing)
MTCTVHHVVGARPNFMKLAPVLRALDARDGFESVLVHTGQHYDHALSGAFFESLGIREPDERLGVGSGSHAVQTAGVMTAFDALLDRRPADLVVVVGDVNSTVAAALVAAKRHIPVAHVEAGLRSGDWKMPEEVNRVLTDRMSDLLFTTERSAHGNLVAEGIPEDRIHFVGNVMIDTLMANIERARASDALEREGVRAGEYALVTLHRPSNVDDREVLAGILEALETIAGERPVLLPVHPRTRGRMDEFGLEPKGLKLLEPLDYLDFLALQAGAALVLTDSGGVQEETTVLGVPCLTLRDSTERPITVTEGTNRMVPDRSPDRILEAYREAVAGARKTGSEPRRPEGWDGRAAERIADALEAWWRERA